MIVPPIMAMTTAIPDGITTPDTLDTQLGGLMFFDGGPGAETTDRIYNRLDFTHAYQACMTADLGTTDLRTDTVGIVCDEPGFMANATIAGSKISKPDM